MATEDQIRDFERKWWGLLLCRMWEQWQNEYRDEVWNRSRRRGGPNNKPKQHEAKT